MDADFIYDQKAGTYSIQCEGEFGALARFVNSELTSKQQITEFISWLEQTDRSEQRFTEWVVEIEEADVTIIANLLTEQELDSSNESDHEGSLDWELTCLCGKPDLIKLLKSYLKFMS